MYLRMGLFDVIAYGNRGLDLTQNVPSISMF